MAIVAPPGVWMIQAACPHHVAVVAVGAAAAAGAGCLPGTTGGASNPVGPMVPFGYSQLRGGYIPTASNPEQEPVSVSADTRIPYIPSAAHAVVFGGGRPMVGGIGTPNRTGFAGTQMPATAPHRPPTR